MPLNWIPLAASALGIGGSLLTGGDDNTDALKKQFEQLSRTGIGVDKLAAPGVRAVNTAYGDAVNQAQANAASSGLSGTSLQNAGNADLFQRRAKGVGDVYAQATAQNEASKERARNALLGLLGMRSSQQNATQQALGALTGAGIQGMLRGYMNEGNTNPYKVDIDQYNKDILGKGDYSKFIFG